MIGIIDYGMGNLRSVQKALERLGCEAAFQTDPQGIDGLDGLILPGVGAFRDAIAQLQQQGFVDPIRKFADSGRPFLGICLGQQLLFERSYEDGEYEGLGIIPGEVVRFQPEPGLKIPHMGWNELEILQPAPLFDGLQTGDSVYFVHSYYVTPDDPRVVAATATHGSQTFAAAITRDNVCATQFHPEKSQQVGLRILENFARMAASGIA